MNETLDNLFTKCQQLPDEDFGVLMSAMMREQKDRDCRAQKEAWQRVVEALNGFMKEYGSVSVMRTGDQPCNALILRHHEFVSPAVGELEVEA